MSEVLVDGMRKGSDPALDGTDDKALEQLLEKFDPSNPDAPIEGFTPEGAPVETPPVEPETPAEAPVEAAVVEPDPVPEIEPEIDLAASEKEGERIAREALEAKLALLEAHNSRLAGKLGFFEQKLKAIPQASEPYEPQTQAEVDRLTALENRLADSEARRNAAEVSQAIAAEINALDGAWTKELAEEVAVIAPKYVDQIKAAQESTDPATARLIAKAVGLMVQAEAKQMHWDSKHKTLVERKAATVSASASAKRAATVSGSGAVPSPPPKPTSVADMTADEADKWLRENVR